jgi:hypothetical protein
MITRISPIAARRIFSILAAPYYGEFKPENLLFNANLQEFAQKVSFICNLETGGKISSLEAYEKIKALWKDLKQSKKGLEIGENPFQKDDDT